jgi:hypothetical protein
MKRGKLAEPDTFFHSMNIVLQLANPESKITHTTGFPYHDVKRYILRIAD